MKKIIFSSMFLAAILVASCTENVVVQNNTLTAREKAEGWTLLFDGKSFDGWRQYNGTGISDFWSIDDEAMRIAPMSERPPRDSEGPRVRSSCIIFADRTFLNFELSIDWKVAKGANSGIFYYVQEIPGQNIFAAAPEIQVLDNWNARDNVRTRHLAGSLYGILPALPSNARPHGEWNTVVVRVKDGHATHTQNGVKVVEYTLWTEEWDELVANSNMANWPNFNPSREGGFIGLQDHQDYAVWFRNVKIREL